MHSVIQQLPKKKLTDLKDYCSIRSVASGQELDEIDNLLDFFKLLEDEDEIALDNIGLLKDFSEQVLKNKKVKNYIEEYESELIYIILDWVSCQMLSFSLVAVLK